MLTQPAAQLYLSMLKDIDSCCDLHMDKNLELETCFQIATRYSISFQAQMQDYVFPNKEEEIEYFKKWKPLFNAEIEYYGFRHHAQLFKDSTSDPVALQSLNTREGKRLDKFIVEHTEFYIAYTTGNSSRDEEWFTEQTNETTSNPERKSSHDGLVSTLLALEKYAEFMLTMKMV